MIKNYVYLTMFSGVSFHEELLISEDINLGDQQLHFKFLAVMRSVYDSLIYHEMCAKANLDTNSIHLTLPHTQTCLIRPGKYIFDVVSRSNTNSHINKIIEGIIYVHSSIGLEAYKKAQKNIL